LRCQQFKDYIQVSLEALATCENHHPLGLSAPATQGKYIYFFVGSAWQGKRLLPATLNFFQTTNFQENPDIWYATKVAA